MINFCWYKTLLSTAKVPMQQQYNCSEAKEEEKYSFRDTAGCSSGDARNIMCGCFCVSAHNSACVDNLHTKYVCVGVFCMCDSTHILNANPYVFKLYVTIHFILSMPI